MNPVGSVIAGYRVQRVVGSGGMGTVYAVRDPQLPRTDALKVLSAELSADPQFRGRFMREADIAAMLDHPNIVRTYDVGEHEGQPFLVMELVQGTTLAQLVRAHHAYDPQPDETGLIGIAPFSATSGSRLAGGGSASG